MQDEPVEQIPADVDQRHQSHSAQRAIPIPVQLHNRQQRNHKDYRWCAESKAPQIIRRLSGISAAGPQQSRNSVRAKKSRRQKNQGEQKRAHHAFRKDSHGFLAVPRADTSPAGDGDARPEDAGNAGKNCNDGQHQTIRRHGIHTQARSCYRPVHNGTQDGGQGGKNLNGEGRAEHLSYDPVIHFFPHCLIFPLPGTWLCPPCSAVYPGSP